MNDALVKYQLMEYMKMSLQRYIILFYVPTVFSFAHGDLQEQRDNDWWLSGCIVKREMEKERSTISSCFQQNNTRIFFRFSSKT